MQLPLLPQFNIVNPSDESVRIFYEEFRRETMPMLLDLPLETWNSLKVLHDEPEVWRLWLQLGKIRLNLHLIAPCDHPFFHFHPWWSIVECIAGGYWHRTAMFRGAKEELIYALEKKGRSVQDLTLGLTTHLTLIVPGCIYPMTDLRKCHAVDVERGSKVWNSSVMITGEPYFPGASKLLSRKPPVANPPLVDEEKLQVLNPVRKRYGLVEW